VQIRLSLRGKGRVDVAELAAKLGGGGHESAAGCTLEGPLADALERILPPLRAALAAFKADEA
jgi:phosphoesterase RecJ-like protein